MHSEQTITITTEDLTPVDDQTVMSNRIREILVLTRTNLDVPFHPKNSVFWYETEPIECQSHKYFTEMYVNTGKAEVPPNRPILSDDGFSIMHEIIHNDISCLREVWMDSFWVDNRPVEKKYQKLNNISVKESYFFVDTNQPIKISSN